MRHPYNILGLRRLMNLAEKRVPNRGEIMAQENRRLQEP
jgi:hypothetical protein